MPTEARLTTLVVSCCPYLRRDLASRLRCCEVLAGNITDVVGVETRLDVLILDAELADVETVEQQRRVRHAGIIIIIGHGLESDQRIDYLDAGADEVIALPMNLDVLIARINAMFRRTYPPE